MDIIVTSDSVDGKIRSISSKSDFLRLLVCSVLSSKPTKIIFNNMCDDILVGIYAAKSLGARIEQVKGGITVYPMGGAVDYTEINCGESGALFRFLIPCANYFCKRVRFEGRGGLAVRPIEDFLKLLSEHGLQFSNNRLPFEVSGEVQSGEYFISGDISSQYVSGLLFILPLLKGESRIVLTTKLQSEKYVDLTIKRLKDFGVNVLKCGREIFIKGNQEYSSVGTYQTESDWSYAAAVMCVGAAGGRVAVSDLNMDSVQPDKQIIDILRDMGVEVECNGTEVIVSKSMTSGVTTDLSGCPDLFPILAALSSCAGSGSTFYGTERLIYKESNRLYSVSSMLNSLGANIKYSKDKVNIKPVKGLYGGTVSSFGDHRVVMAATVAAKLCKRDVKILGAECIEKSAPEFLKVIESCTRRK